MCTGYINFTRPLLPYDCKAMGGCGAGTKRTPARYCAIDPTLVKRGYNFAWDHHSDTRRRLRRLGERPRNRGEDGKGLESETRAHAYTETVHENRSSRERNRQSNLSPNGDGIDGAAVSRPNGDERTDNTHDFDSISPILAVVTTTTATATATATAAATRVAATATKANVTVEQLLTDAPSPPSKTLFMLSRGVTTTEELQSVDSNDEGEAMVMLEQRNTYKY